MSLDKKKRHYLGPCVDIWYWIPCVSGSVHSNWDESWKKREKKITVCEWVCFFLSCSKACEYQKAFERLLYMLHMRSRVERVIKCIMHTRHEHASNEELQRTPLLTYSHRIYITYSIWEHEEAANLLQPSLNTISEHWERAYIILFVSLWWQSKNLNICIYMAHISKSIVRHSSKAKHKNPQNCKTHQLHRCNKYNPITPWTSVYAIRKTHLCVSYYAATIIYVLYLHAHLYTYTPIIQSKQWSPE